MKLGDELRQLKACEGHPPLRQVVTVEEGELFWEATQRCSPVARREHFRWFCKNDLYMLLAYCLKNQPAFLRHQWFVDRCREVQEQPDNMMDFWPRGSGKSTVISFALTIQDILNDPENTFLFLSHNRPTARKFVTQIKTQFETDDVLIDHFPEVLWKNPQREAPEWSKLDGITVKRKGNPRERTLESFGLTDGQPTSGHWGIIIYDDVVVDKSVKTAAAILETTNSWQASLSLSSMKRIRRILGTWWHEADTYHKMIEQKFAPLRLRPPGYNGVYPPGMSQEEMVRLRNQELGPRLFALQILLNLKEAASNSGFQDDWWREWDDDLPLSSMHTVLLVDPAKGTDGSRSRTCMWVLGLDPYRRIRVLDGICAHLGLREKALALVDFHRKYKPARNLCFYESYGQHDDIPYIQTVMAEQSYKFHITEIGGKVDKDVRIEWLTPLFLSAKIQFPKRGIWFVDPRSHQRVNMVTMFHDQEYVSWPFSANKDMLDCLARIEDPKVKPLLTYPKPYGLQGSISSSGGGWGNGALGGGSWMSE